MVPLAPPVPRTETVHVPGFCGVNVNCAVPPADAGVAEAGLTVPTVPVLFAPFVHETLALNAPPNAA
jgi:hypothetical protein